MALLMAAGTASMAHSAPVGGRASKTVEVRFAQGATSGQFAGSLRGYQMHAYRFNALKGQVLNVDLGSTPPGIDVAVNYLGRKATPVLGYGDQVLPYTGRYEVRVLQTRAAARQHGNALRSYEMAISIEGGKPQVMRAEVAVGGAQTIVDAPWLLYRCAAGKTVRARYHYGEAVAHAEIEADGRTLALQYGEGSNREQDVFKGDGYTWSVDRTGPGKAGARNGFLYKNTIMKVNGVPASVDQIVVKNCDLMHD